MKNLSPENTAHGLTISLSHGRMENSDDTKDFQQLSARLYTDEQHTEIEHLHPYGLSTKPKGPSGSGTAKKWAETILAYLGGNRTNGVALMVGDRRFRMKNLSEGEVVLHDDQGNQVYLSRDKIIVYAVKEVHSAVGDARSMLTTEKAKIQKGTASVTAKDGKVFLGAEDVTHAVVTLDGPSKVVFAAITETDTAPPTLNQAKV